MRRKTWRLVGICVATVLAASIPLLAQLTNISTHNERPVNLEEILRTFRFPLSSKSTNEELNQKLITTIRDRRVNFLLDDKITKELKDAGASEDLLKTIDTCITPRERQGIIDDATTIKRKKKRLKEITQLEDQIRDLYPRKDRESIKKMIEVGKEYLKKFGNDDDAKQMVDYLKLVLPKWEELIEVDHFPKKQP